MQGGGARPFQTSTRPLGGGQPTTGLTSSFLLIYLFIKKGLMKTLTSWKTEHLQQSSHSPLIGATKVNPIKPTFTFQQSCFLKNQSN